MEVREVNLMANSIYALALAVLFEDFTNPNASSNAANDIKLVGVRNYTDGVNNYVEDWESEVSAITFTVPQIQTGSTLVAQLAQDITFSIAFPSGTTSIVFNTAQLVDRNDRDKVYVEGTIGDGSNVTYTGVGEFTITDFDIEFNPAAL